MTEHLSVPLAAGHRLLPDTARAMAKASLADVRKADLTDWKAQIGTVVRTVRGALSLKEFADVIDRDERQVARWEKGEERPQLDAIFAVSDFRAPLVIALAQLSDAVSVETTITVRRRA